MSRLIKGNQELGSKLAALLLAMALASAVNLSGCAANTPPQPSATPTAKPQSAPAAKATAPASTVTASQSLQELIVREERGQTTLLVKFNRPVTQYRHFPLPQPARVVLDISTETKGLTLSDTFRVETGIVSALRLEASEKNLRLVVEVAAAIVPPYTIATEDGGLKIVVGSGDPTATAKKNLTLVKDGKRTDLIAGGAACPSIGEVKTSPSSPVAQSTAEKKYAGPKISLDFKDADIKNVFRLLGEVGDKNILVTDDVKQRLTIRLIEVPWDLAFDLIIDTNGLAKEESDNVIRVSTAARLIRDRKDQLDARNAARSVEIPQIVYLNVNYAKAKELVDKVKLIVKGDADVVPDDRSNTIVVRGTFKDVNEIACIVSRLDIRTTQVLIESNLIETTPSFSKALGLELDSIFNNGRVITSSRFLSGAPFGGSAQGVLPALIVPASGFRFGYFGNNISGVLSAAENEGLIKIISRPSVTTLNNVSSTIKSERILRILTPASTNIASGSGAAAGAAVATEKIPVGITLSVTPQVSSDGFVLMNIKVKSSSIANSPTVSGGVGGVVPFDELNREAEANVLVRDGETIVIGGILKDTDNSSTSGVPYLKDIPVLGWLFKNWRVQKDFEELVVFITPRIASAGSENLPSADQLWREQMKKTQGDQPAFLSGNP